MVWQRRKFHSAGSALGSARANHGPSSCQTLH
jgi:hypothetical protein